MIKTALTLILATIIFSAPGMAFAKTITLAVDNRNWIPFTFQEGGKTVGMNIDVVKKAVESLGHELVIKPFPRKRCFLNVKNGSVDGMISISYHDDLSKIMNFPKDAATAQESEWRIMQIDHVLVTAKNQFEFSGDIGTLPQPVRVPVGETLTIDIQRAGLKVDEAKTDLQNFKKMKRDKKGSIVTTTIIAEKMNEDPAFKDQFRIHATPLTSLSYFAAFSKKSKLSSAEQQQLWDEIKKWRDDYVFMLQVYAHY